MTAGYEYASALFSVAEQEGCADTVYTEITAVAAAMSENPQYKTLLDTPSLPKEKKLSLIDEAFSSLSEYTLNTLKILCERRLAHVIPALARAYGEIYDDARGITRVVAETAVPMSEEQARALAQRLGAELKREIIAKNEVTPAMLGGVKLRYSGLQIDGSVKTRLDRLSASIKDVIV